MHCAVEKPQVDVASQVKTIFLDLCLYFISSPTSDERVVIITGVIMSRVLG